MLEPTEPPIADDEGDDGAESTPTPLERAKSKGGGGASTVLGAAMLAVGDILEPEKTSVEIVQTNDDPIDDLVPDATYEVELIDPKTIRLLDVTTGDVIEIAAPAAPATSHTLEVDATLDFDPVRPGDPSKRRKISPSDSNWDAVAGFRGRYRLADRWSAAYNVLAGAGESDSVWEAQAALEYKFSGLEAIVGWRYFDYDIGSDTVLTDLSANGPFLGAIFRW